VAFDVHAPFDVAYFPITDAAVHLITWLYDLS
jgi:hypothetical protein